MKKILVALAMIVAATSAQAKDPLPNDMKNYSLQDLYAQCGVYFYQAGNVGKFNTLLVKGEAKFGSGFKDHWRKVTMEVISLGLSNYEFKQLMEMKYYAWGCYYADMS